LPSFIKLQGKQIAIDSKKDKEKGLYLIEIGLDDGFSKPKTYEMKVHIDIDPN